MYFKFTKIFFFFLHIVGTQISYMRMQVWVTIYLITQCSKKAVTVTLDRIDSISFTFKNKFIQYHAIGKYISYSKAFRPFLPPISFSRQDVEYAEKHFSQ